MTETTPEAVVEEETPTSRKAVYDYAELRFVDPSSGESPEEAVKRLNAANKDGKNAGRADGSRGQRYALRDV